MGTMWTGIDGRPRAGAWVLLVATLALLLVAAEHTVADAQAPPAPVRNVAVLTGSPTLVQMIEHEFAGNAPAALNIATCESRLQSVRSPANADGSHDWGIFQLNDGGTLQELGGTVELAMIPEWNVSAAHRLFARHGWKRWQCRPDGTRRH
jgi:hypothetical protein